MSDGNKLNCPHCRSNNCVEAIKTPDSMWVAVCILCWIRTKETFHEESAMDMWGHHEGNNQ